MIAVDAISGESAPHAAVQGALIVARKNVKVGLYGDQVQLFSLLYEHDMHWERLPIQVFHCSTGVTDSSTALITQKKESSLMRALQDLHIGNATALVSMGNSEAVLAGSSLILGRIAGIKKSAVGMFLSSHAKGGTFCVDLGVNTDCKPEHMVQFAVMGHVYSKMTYHVATPRIGLLSSGHESYKGSLLVKETYDALKQHSKLHFVGNVEPNALFNGQVDVLISDGFSGNIMLKTIEAAATAFFDWIDYESQRSLRGIVTSFLSRPLLYSIKKRIGYERKGGALLLGVRQPIVVIRGASGADAVAAAIMLAHKKVKSRFIERFATEVEQLLGRMSSEEQRIHQVGSRNLHSVLEFDKSV